MGIFLKGHRRPSGEEVEVEHGGSSFDGCRYHVQSDHLLFGNLIRQYDTSNYSEVDEFGVSITDEIVMPRDGFYRITASARMSFVPDDLSTLGVKILIVSAERDGDWDTDDHFTIPHTDDALEGAGGLTVTHWLAASETVSLRLLNAGGGADPNPFRAALEVEFVGTGTNPAAESTG